MKYGEHRDKLYSIEERFLIQLLESLRKENKDLFDKVDGLQGAQVYVHNHISQVENAVNQIQTFLYCVVEHSKCNGQIITNNLVHHCFCPCHRFHLQESSSKSIVW